MKNKKGFTLVEVLAVVILLGIISAIIYPVLNGVLEENRRKAFIQSLNGIVRTADMYKADNNNNLGVIDYDDDLLDISYDQDWLSGTVSLELDSTTGDKKVYLTNFYNGEFCGTGFENNFTVTKGVCPEKISNYCFEFSNNTITNYHSEYSSCPRNIVIPEMINNEDVLYIGTGAFADKKLISVTLSESLIGIGPGAFYDSYLTLLDNSKASNLEYIGEWAFAYNDLNKVDFTKFTSLKYIDAAAFYYAGLEGTVDLSQSTNLVSIGDINNWDNGSFEENYIDTVIITGLPNLTYIGTNAFEGNYINGELNLSNNPSLEFIDYHAFRSNESNITKVNLSGNTSLGQIGYDAFSYSYISEVSLANCTSLTYIDSHAFYDNNITSVDFTNNSSLEVIEEYAFMYNNITTLDTTGLSNLTSISQYAFASSQIQNLDFSNFSSLETIGQYAFANNQLTSFSASTIPTLTSIGRAAFNGNNLPEAEAYVYQIGTKEIVSYGGRATVPTVPTDTTSIGEYAFANNTYINTINLSSNTALTNIKPYAFYSVSNLNSLTLPSNLTTIGTYGFYGSRLSSVTIPLSVTSIGSNAFKSNVSWTNVTIESDSEMDKYRFSQNWISIGWPSSLRPIPSPIDYTLVTNVANNFDYFGSYYKVTIPTTGTYKLEVWGAQGGSYSNYVVGGKGGYSYGNISLSEGDILYVYVGGQGVGSDGTTGTRTGGFNGGGNGYIRYTSYGGTGGGGATDIRVGNDSLYARVIVAGGGGGAGSYSGNYYWSGGYGGGTSGGTNPASQTVNYYYYGYAGSLSSAGKSYYMNTYNNSSYGTLAGFGIGGSANSTTTSSAGGGGGWYGGGYSHQNSGGGGSGYIYTSSYASYYPSGCLLNSTYYLTSASTTNGGSTAIQPNGTSTVGHSGNGYARITFVS